MPPAARRPPSRALDRAAAEEPATIQGVRPYSGRGGPCEAEVLDKKCGGCDKDDKDKGCELMLVSRLGAQLCVTLLQYGDAAEVCERVRQFERATPTCIPAIVCNVHFRRLSQYGDAAEMYERAGQYERAASIYIQTKNFAAATPLMARISSSKLQLQFAKAKEQEG
eukprot:scaffold178069_cov25-Tisochrysis_lutea.AAC.3